MSYVSQIVWKKSSETQPPYVRDLERHQRLLIATEDGSIMIMVTDSSALINVAAYWSVIELPSELRK